MTTVPIWMSRFYSKLAVAGDEKGPGNARISAAPAKTARRNTSGIPQATPYASQRQPAMRSMAHPPVSQAGRPASAHGQTFDSLQISIFRWELDLLRHRLMRASLNNGLVEAGLAADAGGGVAAADMAGAAPAAISQDLLTAAVRRLR